MQAAAAAGVSAFILFPLDVLATRAQSGRGAAALSSKALREAGLFGLPRGALCRAVQTSLETAGFFVAYSFLSRLAPAHRLARMLACYCASWLHVPLTMPLDAAVVRTITQRKPLPRVAREMAARPMDSYKGASALWLANARVVLVLVLNSSLKRYFLVRQAMVGGSAVLLSARSAAMSVGISTTVVDTLLYPTRRIIVTRQSYAAQLERGEISPWRAREMERMGNWQLLNTLAREGGWRSIFSGLLLTLLRGVLSAAMMPAVSESVQMALSSSWRFDHTQAMGLYRSLHE